MAALRGFEKVVEVGGGRHVVKVVDGGAGLRKGRGDGVLLKIKIAAEVDGVRGVSPYVGGGRGWPARSNR